MDYCAICSYVEQMIKIVESGKGNGTAALARGLRLLECIAKDQAQTSLHDHATALDIPYATARRMIATLDQSGFVVRVGAGRYRAGPALVGLADVLDLRSLLVILEDLADDREEGIELGLGTGGGPAISGRLGVVEDLLERVPVDVEFATDGSFALAIDKDATADLGPVLHVRVHP